MSAEPSTSAKKPFGNGSIKNAAIPQPRSRTHLKVMDETPPYNGLIEGLRARLGPHGVLTDPADTAPYCEDWRRLYYGRTPAVLRPASTAEVADAVRLCAEQGCRSCRRAAIRAWSAVVRSARMARKSF